MLHLFHKLDLEYEKIYNCIVLINQARFPESTSIAFVVFTHFENNFTSVSGKHTFNPKDLLCGQT